MTDQPFRGQKWSWDSKRAVPFFPSLHHEPGSETAMFIQDITQGIVPTWNFRGEGGTFKADIAATESDRERVIALLWSLGGGESHHDFEELVADGIQKIAGPLSFHGRALYEIGHAKEDGSVYLLSNFTSARSFNLQFWWLQVIPVEDREFWKKSKSIIERRHVWAVYMPRALGGHRGYRALLHKLDRFQSSGPRFWRHDLAHGRPLQSYFSFEQYRRNIDIYVSRTTRRWGWNRRDFTERNWTEFMQFHRTVTFHWAQAVLREHIVAEFNLLLVRLGIDAQLSVSGLPTSEEILRLRNEMMEGRASFRKVLDVLRA